MSDLQSFSHTAEKYRMAARDITRAQRVIANGPRNSWGLPLLSSIYSNIANLFSHGIGHDLAHFPRGPAGHIFLPLIMHFQDLNIHIVLQDRYYSFQKLIHDIYHLRRIRRIKHRNLFCRLFELLDLFFCKSGSTADQSLSMCHNLFQHVHSHFFGRKINDHITIIDHRFQVIRYRNPQFPANHSHGPQIRANIVPPFGADACRQLKILSFGRHLGD